jgi:hypothetical protein
MLLWLHIFTGRLGCDRVAAAAQSGSNVVCAAGALVTICWARVHGHVRAHCGSKPGRYSTARTMRGLCYAASHLLVLAWRCLL